MKHYTIQETAKLLSVTPQTLRNWDKKDYFKPSFVAMNGYRYYSENQEKQHRT